jgi:outer membrane scaffolding protein for murein synthesis (MipA/OmpV family)
MSRLRGDAAESPIIEKKTQPSLLAAVSRPF